MTSLVEIAYRPKQAYRAPRPNEGAQTANHANSTSPTSATLSNSAAGYTTLGGRFQFVPVDGAATDYALFAYQVPSTHRLVINGVAISTLVAIAIGANGAQLDWSLGLNGTAVDLSTADSGTTQFATRRLPLGRQGFIATAAAGVQAPEVVRQFRAPLIVEPTRYCHVILQVPVGTVTTGLIRGDIMFDGWFEAADSIINGG